MQKQLVKVPGYEKWFIEKENRPYIDAFERRKEDLVYLTADSETTIDELDQKKIYIIGGLVDRNRWKGITMDKAKDQGIQTARLPIGEYLKMSSSQVIFFGLSPTLYFFSFWACFCFSHGIIAVSTVEFLLMIIWCSYLK